MDRLSPSSLVPFLPLVLAACGGGGDGGAAPGATTSSDVALRFSDAPVEALERVVVTVESIAFHREDGEDIVVERFTSDELGLDDAERFTLDLLAVQGDDSRLVLDSVVLPVGRYSDLRLDVVDEDLNASFVEESAGSALKTLKVPSGELKLGGFEVSPLATQTFVVEFGLRQSMTYNPGPDRYLLKPRGVRVVRLEEAAGIEGRVDLSALHERAPCDEKADPAVGNVVYLYAGHGLDAAALADDFDAGLAGSAGDGRLAPLASATLGEDGRFVLSWLEPGDYTLAASCRAEGDDADALDGLAVPLPTDQRVELALERGVRGSCALGGPAPACTTTATAAETTPAMR